MLTFILFPQSFRGSQRHCRFLLWAAISLLSTHYLAICPESKGGNNTVLNVEMMRRI